MKIDQDLPRDVRELEHVRIPMPDGTHLAARIWMPEGAEDAPVPAVLEYIPYRKNDKTLERDHARAPWIAARGYAYVRLDIRGTGESEGVMEDEYTEIELQDGCDAIAWIADQAWCDGGVGIVGISWGGFNGLQIAALRPPALKAVVTICSTDDRYADDIHYMGGTLLVDQLSWASVMFGINTLPPDPAHVGDDWRRLWEERLDGSGLWLKTWLEHQTRDDFWKHGSVCEDWDDIEVPVYAVSGWADGYCRSVFRLVEKLKSPAKGIVGPWSHKYPHLGEPGPAIDWLTEEVRWWDRWLKDRDTGIDAEPALTLYLQDHAEPRSHYDYREGQWIALPSWPAPEVASVAFPLGSDGTLGVDGAPRDVQDIASPLWVGTHGGKWCSYAHPGDQPGDQRRDDAGSLTYTTEPLEAPMHLVGDGTLSLSFTADRPVAQVAVRVSDVAPDGAATRVCYGLLNFTHRNGHEFPEPLVPGKTYEVRVPLKHVAQTFRAGHRMRLSISSAYFPIAWPAPETATLSVDTDRTLLHLPLLTGEVPAGPDLGTPRAAEPLPLDVDVPPQSTWTVTENRDTDRITVRVTDHEGAVTIVGQDFYHSADCEEVYSVLPNDPTSVTGRVAWEHVMARGEWRVRTLTETQLTSDATHFRVEARMQAWDGEDLVRDQSWDERIPRNLV